MLADTGLQRPLVTGMVAGVTDRRARLGAAAVAVTYQQAVDMYAEMEAALGAATVAACEERACTAPPFTPRQRAELAVLLRRGPHGALTQPA